MIYFSLCCFILLPPPFIDTPRLLRNPPDNKPPLIAMPVDLLPQLLQTIKTSFLTTSHSHLSLWKVISTYFFSNIPIKKRLEISNFIFFSRNLIWNIRNKNNKRMHFKQLKFNFYRKIKLIYNCDRTHKMCQLPNSPLNENSAQKKNSLVWR